MNIFDVIQSRRTIRKFNNSKNIDKNYLFDMIKLGSLHPSRMNKQPLEFIIIDNKQICNNIFSKILWGIKNKTNKVFSDKNYSPVAYIAILHNKTILEKGFKYDVGACAENIMIYANSLGIGSVWLHSILKIDIIDILNIPKDIYNLDSLIGLGYPSHNSNITSLNSKGISYYIDGKLNLFVPKRDINKITHINKY